MKALAEDWQAPVKNQNQTSSEQRVVIDWDWKRYLVDQGMAPENLPLRAGLTRPMPVSGRYVLPEHRRALRKPGSK
jgi:hypothetical protein